MFMHRSKFSVGRSTLFTRSIVTNPKGYIPYGLSNWKLFREKQFIFVDNTKAIAKLDEATLYSCLWSPRRTGKSLLVNQLSLWHDKAISGKKRTELFSGTYIGENPSADAGKYLVLVMDFSKVQDDNIHESFMDVVNASVSRFSEKYHDIGMIKRHVRINNRNCMSSIEDLATVVDLSGQKLSLIIDEVDSFANRLLVRVSREKGLDSSGYNEFVKKEGSVLRDFGRVVKAESSTCIERMFFTGVMPVAWADAFSSLNTVEDLTHTNAFQDTLGFKSSDIEELLLLLFSELTPEVRRGHLESMRSKCNGYRRSSSQVEGMYNPQGVWYYLKQLRDKGDQMVPRMDPNIVQPARDEVAAFMVEHAASARTYSPVHFFTGNIPFTPLQRFSAESLFNPVRAPEALLSMAHYCGYLSFQYPKDEMYGDVLVAPNDEMKEVFIDAVLQSLPGEYQKNAVALAVKYESRASAVKEVYDKWIKASRYKAASN